MAIEEPVNYEDLDFEKQCDIVSGSPLSKKGEFIVRSQHPEKMVQYLSSEELFLISKETESEMVPELLEHATLEQITFFNDMLVWKKDRINPDQFIEYLDTLVEASIDQLAAWLTNCDLEILIAGYKKIISVQKAQDTEDTVEDRFGTRLFFTIDGYYHISVDENNFEVVKRSLEILYSTEPHLYITVIEGIISESLSEMEEYAYQLRQNRLNERGFPEPEVAYRIYRRLDTNEWNSLEKKEAEKNKNHFTLQTISLLTRQEDRLFFDEILLSLYQADESFKESIQQELIGLANKIAAVSGMEFSNEKNLKECIEQAHRFINIGLEDASKKEVQLARQIVGEYWLEDIFRRGYTALLKPRVEALQIVTDGGFSQSSHLVRFLPEEFRGFFSGILLKIPKFCPLNATLEELEYRDFKSIDEIDNALHFISGMAWIINRLTSSLPAWKKEYSLLAQSLQGNDEITLSMLLLTMFVRFVTTENISLEPVTLPQLHEFLIKTSCYRQKEPSKEEHQYLASFLSLFSNTNDHFYGMNLFNDIMMKNREEYFSLSPKGKLDNRYLSFVVLQENMSPTTI